MYDLGVAVERLRAARQAIDASLKRLQTDHLDLYQIHWPARNVPNFGQTSFNPDNEREAESIDAQLRVMDELVRAGMATAADLARWDAAFTALDTGRVAFTLDVVAVVGRRPALPEESS